MNYPPARPAQPYWADVVIRVVGGIVGAIALGVFALGAYMVLSTRLSSNPFADPHGYGLIIGMVLALPCGLLASGTLPLALPRRQWLRAFTIGFVVYLASAALLIYSAATMPNRPPPCATNPPAPHCKHAP
ncbi:MULTISPECIES: hypothetical protein [Mycobacteroides]|jgi:hypothetical protein|uniref:Transmembrane protein n=1 Tax=Mycobacteroides chelonae TaxID=1774 RepID=A0A1S1K9S5_MYCCH|nr:MULTISPECIES: hypothetical protein [Mycobacteroides]KRQ18931.1 hypothetical protein AOT87_24635 [Mycobacteroides sp. H003]KRQ21361.1 hypothetical protein AOT91_25425 [Mycobacteroides sp. H092]KRQ28859.1 hypothetical protein AOT86_06260 [Mycobacteroides sp. H072]KRQ38679.1 hypothetical protein AOT84_09595 [Mycobacteroides sp. H002]KRQ44411.1 hypothetical protein AOT92_05450 [Mycobacteroides sp. H101]